MRRRGRVRWPAKGWAARKIVPNPQSLVLRYRPLLAWPRLRIDAGGFQVGVAQGGRNECYGAPLSIAWDAWAWRSQWIDALGSSRVLFLQPLSLAAALSR